MPCIFGGMSKSIPTLFLTDELRAKVTYSGILMIVMSPRYLTSAWCKDELEWFKQQVLGRARDQGRVFVIRALHTDEKLWPDFLRDARGHALTGFRFYDKPFNPHGWREAGENSEPYVRELGRLQTALVKRLRELRVDAERQDQSGNACNCRAAVDRPAADLSTCSP